MNEPTITPEPKYGILQYSNTWGHLIITLATMGIGVYLVVTGFTPIGLSLLGLATSSWFIPGAAKQMAYEVQSLPATGVLPVAIKIVPTVEHILSSSVATTEGHAPITTATETTTTKGPSNDAIQPNTPPESTL